MWAGGPIAGAVFTGLLGEKGSSHTNAGVRRSFLSEHSLRTCRWGPGDLGPGQAKERGQIPAPTWSTQLIK